ncbi:hypothetical protein SM0020_06717 [Sinorhizobium meliloti CCNWSX0020]|uniref:Uncharacterized protein n=1 Tax=Sinorhizobium meliloti CCNWSX0020 TaxID=1107881 RepID=H0FVY3_RHIML|nr:hypothetical protein SM0020_06717 [Sinorhizobium meliloti CCNWSX0020]
MQIGIIEHGERVLAAHLQLVLAIVLDRGDGDPLSRRGGAGEGDRLDVRAVEHRLAEDRALAHDEGQHTLGQACAVEDIDDRPRTARNQLGRLEDDGVAVAERRGDLPGGNGDREVPRRDDADDPCRLVGDLDADPRPDRRDDLTRKTQGLAGEELEYLAGADRLADTLASVLPSSRERRRPSSSLRARISSAVSLQDRMPLENAGARPRGKGGLCRRDRGFRVFVRETACCG